MKWKIEYLNKATFISIIIITSDFIGPNDTTRTRFRSRFVSRRQEMAEMQKEMMETETTTEMEPAMMEMNNMEMEMEAAKMNSSTDTMKELSSSSSSNMNVIADENRDTRGIRGFIPGFNLGGGNSNTGGGGSGRGLLRGLKGGGGGLFGSLGADGGGKENSGNNNFPEFPSNNAGSTSANSGNSGWSQSETTTPSSTGWSQSGSSSGGKGGLFSSFPGASLFRNPFGGGKGGRGNGKGPLRLLSRLNQDQPCAAGLSSLPILSRLPFIPQKRFPSFIPSGVNTCDATCGGGGATTWRRVPPTKEEKEQMGMDDNNNCTYNWRDSLTGLPFLLFRCQCKKCPQKRVRIGGIFSSQCENVSGMKTRCKCPYGQDSYKCTITILPLSVPFIQRKKPYYCACCNENPSSPLGPTPSGGYDLSPAQATPSTPAVQEVQQSMPTVEEVGGYGYGGANSASGTMPMEQGASSSSSGNSVVQREFPIGRPLGTEHFYEHL